jgi:hypothetical protein
MVVSWLTVVIVIPLQDDEAMTIRADVFARRSLEMTSAKTISDVNGMFEHGKVLQ